MDQENNKNNDDEILDIDAIFNEYIPAKLAENIDAIRDLDATFKFVIRGEEAATWIIDFTSEHPCITKAEAETDCTLTIDSVLLKEIINGKTDPISAFMDGQIEFEGDMDKAAAMGLML